jgi:phosphatidylglycerophosphatase C
VTRRVVAAFDFDGTLCPGDSLVPFLRRLLPRPVLARAAAGAWRELAMLPAGGVRRDRAKAALLRRSLAGVELERFAAACDDFSVWLEGRLRPDVLGRARWHQAEDHDVVVVSASPEHYLSPLAGRLGFRSVIGTRLEVDDGVLTGRLLGENCRGPEKAVRLREWLGGGDVLLWAYGDSSGDRELLAAADVATRVSRRAALASPPPPRPAP